MKKSISALFITLLVLSVLAIFGFIYDSIYAPPIY